MEVPLGKTDWLFSFPEEADGGVVLRGSNDCWLCETCRLARSALRSVTEETGALERDDEGDVDGGLRCSLSETNEGPWPRDDPRGLAGSIATSCRSTKSRRVEDRERWLDEVGMGGKPRRGGDPSCSWGGSWSSLPRRGEGLSSECPSSRIGGPPSTRSPPRGGGPSLNCSSWEEGGLPSNSSSSRRGGGGNDSGRGCGGGGGGGGRRNLSLVGRDNWDASSG